MTAGPLEIIAGKSLGQTLTTAVKRAHAAFQERARDILVDQLAKGNKTIADIVDTDEGAARVFQYSEAATKGKARRNLRLLAQLLAAETIIPDTYPDEFSEFFDLLANLSRLEIVVLSRYHRIYREVADAPPTGAWSSIREDLVRQRIVSNDDELLAVVQGLGRTGLLFQRSNGPGTDQPSPKMSRMMRLVDLEAALDEP